MIFVADQGDWMPTPDEIAEAADRIAVHIRTTPIVRTADLTLKLECLQHTGSFKPRGAFNRILSQSVPAAGVIAASGGNHGLAVAYAARRLGLPAEVFVPVTSSPVKVARLRGYGATVTQVGDRYSEAYEASQARAADTGALVVHAYDQPEVQAGQGTVGVELMAQSPELDTIVVAVGGGGLLAGVASAYDGSARIVAVEPRTIPTLAAALDAGEPVDVDVTGIAADSLGATRISASALAVARRTGVRSVLVDDEAIVAARQWLWGDLRLAVEAGGAAAMAALRSGAYVPGPEERVGVIICGSNTDPSDLV
ncbi:MAG TPA: threonine/serine dehydratase [Micromonosporaceae bacterium]